MYFVLNNVLSPAILGVSKESKKSDFTLLYSIFCNGSSIECSYRENQFIYDE